MNPRINRKHEPSPQNRWFGSLRAAVKADRQQRGEPPDLSENDVLAWADAFLARTGDWPMQDSGPIPEAPGETWLLVEASLAFGLRGFAPGGSLARFLAELRGGRSRLHLPPLTISQVLGWADAFHAQTGEWPTCGSGAIAEAPGESWRAVDVALRTGSRELPRGRSLVRLLANERGVHKKAHRPLMTITEILQWADAHHDRSGTWPRCNSGAIPESPGDTWRKVQVALTNGNRGLEGGSSLARLLEEHRGRRHPTRAPDFTISQILAWASAFHIRTGIWPGNASGPIPEAPGETWSAVSNAIQRGSRGLPRSKSLTRLLVEHLGIKSKAHAPPLTTSQVLAWADAFHARTGRWPTALSGPVAEAPGQTWCAIQSSLVEGTRGLPGGSSLFRLLAKERGACITTNRARHTMTDERRVR